MRLLVSVRSAEEVGEALCGGADIIDAKEPSRGSLGAVTASVLTEIVGRVPGDCAVSVALGDLTAPAEVLSALASIHLPRRSAPIYLKIGFAGVSSAAAVETLIRTAVGLSSEDPASPLIVAVAYADAVRAKTLSPDAVCRVAARAGAAGILLDTFVKDGLGLLRWLDSTALSQWVASAHEVGLLAALAGGLGLEDLRRVRATGANVVGVRGAVCEGGREGPVAAGRVRALRQQLRALDSGFVQGPEYPMLQTGSRNA